MPLNKRYTALTALFLAACNPSIEAGPAPDFHAALEQHFEAILTRDLEAYAATITLGEDLPLVFPNGQMMRTRQEVLDFHREWFSDKNWVMEPEILWIKTGKDMAVASTKYSYRDTADGPPRESYLGLVFELQDGNWRLVHDQNTRIEQ